MDINYSKIQVVSENQYSEIHNIVLGSPWQGKRLIFKAYDPMFEIGMCRLFRKRGGRKYFQCIPHFLDSLLSEQEFKTVAKVKQMPGRVAAPAYSSLVLL